MQTSEFLCLKCSRFTPLFMICDVFECHGCHCKGKKSHSCYGFPVQVYRKLRDQSGSREGMKLNGVVWTVLDLHYITEVSTTPHLS